mmetsp:Transcript_42932/g.127278  ORF Transcript_42932/g.127278 Transcript_42932/m.127278 type:complete len:240 (+) Transcript_42932:95-814(+)
MACESALRLPERQVVLEELHREDGVVARLLGHARELSGGPIQRILGRGDGALGVLKDFVLEDREVQGETEAHGMHRGQGVCLLHALHVRLLRILRCPGPGVALGEFREVAVVVALHLEVERLRLPRVGRRHQVGFQECEGLVADALQLGLDLGTVAVGQGGLVGAAVGLLLLRHSHRDANSVAALGQSVLEGRGEHVALLRVQRRVLLDALLHEISHLIVALRALRNARKNNRLVLHGH